MKFRVSLRKTLVPTEYQDFGTQLIKTVVVTASNWNEAVEKAIEFESTVVSCGRATQSIELADSVYNGKVED